MKADKSMYEPAFITERSCRTQVRVPNFTNIVVVITLYIQILVYIHSQAQKYGVNKGHPGSVCVPRFYKA